MKLSLSELSRLLEATGYPVAYREFDVENSEPPSLPFIVYYENNSDNFAADNMVYKKIKDVRIELYSDRKDLAAESKIEKFLDENRVFYDTLDLPIKTEGMLMRIYDITLI